MSKNYTMKNAAANIAAMQALTIHFPHAENIPPPDIGRACHAPPVVGVQHGRP